MLIAGIDEAGRCPCFVPMTIAISVMDKENEKQYFPCVNRLEVKDYEICDNCEEDIYSTGEEFIEYKMIEYKMNNK